MSPRSHLKTLNLSAQPIDYEWDTLIYNTFWACNDEDAPRLIDALMLISTRAAFAFGLACAEWVAARLASHVDVGDAHLRLDAAWAATIDWRYAHLPSPLIHPGSPPVKWKAP